MARALDKRILRITLNVAEMLDVEAQARAVGQSVYNYVQSRLGLQERNVGKRTAEERDLEEDMRWIGFSVSASTRRFTLPDY